MAKSATPPRPPQAQAPKPKPHVAAPEIDVEIDDDSNILLPDEIAGKVASGIELTVEESKIYAEYEELCARQARGEEI